jgi:hypothetical protein
MASSGMWRQLEFISTDLLEEHVASIFRVEEISRAREKLSGAPAARLLCLPAGRSLLNPPSTLQTVDISTNDTPHQGSLSRNSSQSVSYCLTHFLARVISSILKMEATRSSETLVYIKPHGATSQKTAFFIAYI